MKHCSNCLIIKPLDDFPFDKRRNYHQTICKICKHNKEREWRKRAKEGKAYQPKQGPQQVRKRKVKAYYLSVLVEQQHNHCTLCNKPFGTGYNLSPSIDHKIPVIKGGSDELNNLQAIHRLCNNIKSIHTDSNKIDILIHGRGYFQSS